MRENNEVKSDVFSMLMENKVYALEVYNALNDTEYDNPEAIEVKTLEKGISLSLRNDASFIIDMNLNIWEHQSTYNPNMPLRSLIYIVEIVKPLIKDKDIFGRRRIMIPTPRFVVFYNGRENRPAVETLKLSDAFEKATTKPELELICTVYNINPGYNEDFLEKCSVISGYTTFIEKVRSFDEMKEEHPIEEAIKWCISNEILKEFFSKRGQEVLKAMTIDMTWEHREEIIRRDERAEGREEGREEGRAEGAREQLEIDQAIINAKDSELEMNQAIINAKDSELEKYRAFIIKQGINPNEIV